MADDLGEKTELPTQRKMGEARSRGQIAKSQDLAAAIDLVGGVIVVAVLGASLLGAMSGVLRRAIEHTPEEMTIDDASRLVWASLIEVGGKAAPAMGILLVVGILAHAVQIGWLFTTRPLEPKLDRLNPVAGIGRLFQLRNLVKTLLNVVKLCLVITVGWLVLSASLPSVAALPALSLGRGMEEIGELAIEMAAWLLAVLAIIGIADYSYQKWQHVQDLKMTKDEVKDERRSMEGDPEIKGRRIKMARQIAMQRINSAVPKADVVVTNPTHFAVAIRYDEKTMRAPRVVAKGADEMALRIREVAAVHAVPIVERPPLARALYAGVEVGREVSPEFYQAVAEVLAYVYRLERAAA